jgi:hypothetical protein
VTLLRVHRPELYAKERAVTSEEAARPARLALLANMSDEERAQLRSLLQRAVANGDAGKYRAP